jgi:prepilin-type N-terminal cleavage/methylation domain-containing protein
MTAVKPRRAFTLLEMIIVMTIILVIGAAVYPTIDSGYAYFKTTGAADSVKAAWARARARAIEDCVPYRFSVDYSQRRFRVAPDRADYWNGDGVPDPGQDAPALISDGKLASGVAFLRGQEAPGDVAKSSGDDDKSGSANWETIAVFLPDGTARVDFGGNNEVEGSLRMGMKGARPVTLKLRAITGTAKTIVGEEDK